MTPPAKNEARELAAEVLRYLNLAAKVAKSRDGSAGLARVRAAESELRKLCRLIATDDRPAANLFQ